MSTNTFKKLNPGGPQDASWILLPAIGGLCTGAVALIYPEISYQGFSNVNSLLAVNGEDYAPALLIQMLIAKVLVTAVCRGSGLVGGIYAPSIFMGKHLLLVENWKVLRLLQWQYFQWSLILSYPVLSTMIFLLHRYLRILMGGVQSVVSHTLSYIEVL